MSAEPRSFEQPIYVTRPMLPELAVFTKHLEAIWQCAVLSNGGPQHVELEKRLHAHLGDGHIALFNNGTNALMTAVKALDLSGEVITTPFTFAATPHVLAWHGIRPVFADIEEHSMTLDPARIEAAITERTTGILAVHVYGNPCDVEAIERIARKHRLKVLYDGAHAFGTRVNGRPIASYGDATMFSFHATKLFHTAEGGAVVTNDGDVKRRMELLKNFGIADEVTVKAVGINSKMNEIQAAMGLCLVDAVAAEKAKRLDLAHVYRDHLGGVPGITASRPLDLDTDSLQYYCLRIDRAVAGVSRDEVYDRLKHYNVFARRYFYPLCSQYEPYRLFPDSAIDNLPVANRVGDQVLCLPFYGELGTANAERICQILRHIVMDGAAGAVHAA
ncbi:dTDP-4-amino-4,6-dideoxygalactose transaminase [Methylobacterium sp. UNC300MFChir4.1]|uniref:DegT/DnrJ/EryC1/StrS family aminotransferase n=1 Tax=Methylobacterium sp. UNC300MFChir4.1 TaxID=1502747 RepID=UPI0008CCADD7|nr:DegT/DnrJ/EryC1/StrS family aminotransferase [Methylobacterium sp. UNC300MFChir4.1]SEP32296.1 dTDP-4-amino-4,6-dideoxygalactose transaminase [Methylobacterium sp. UNC300MFChir4.1]